MNVTFNTPASLHRFLDCLNGPGRRNLFSVAANALKILVQNHVRTNAPRHHIWADKLGASPTRHHEKGLSKIVSHSSQSSAEVVIPITGFGRAFHDVTLTPKNWTHLTVPVSSHSYGHRAAELHRMGWRIFRPKDHDILMGYRKGEKATTLYALKKQIPQRQDRSLLPSDQQINYTVARAMMIEIQRISRAA